MKFWLQHGTMDRYGTKPDGTFSRTNRQTANQLEISLTTVTIGPSQSHSLLPSLCNLIDAHPGYFECIVHSMKLKKGIFTWQKSAAISVTQKSTLGMRGWEPERWRYSPSP